MISSIILRLSGQRGCQKLIEDKAKGQKRQAAPPMRARSNVIDIVATLQESLAQKKPRKRGAA
jgi:non-homologous end joining protein Ku